MVTKRPRLLFASVLATTLAIGAPGAVLAQPDDTEEAGTPEATPPDDDDDDGDDGYEGDAGDTGDAAPADEPADPPMAPPEEPATPAEPAAPADTAGEVSAEAEGEAAEGEAAEGEEMEGPGEIIVITGSVIERRHTTTPAPVAILDRLDIDASGMVSIGEVLQNLPAQSNAINVNVNNGGDGSTRINLRGLGSNRTLVLLNGRRVVPGGSGADSSVDLSSIPVAIIERIEVLKDGASAIYGSEAIGGVVNIITRQDYEGSEANLYTGTTQHGGGTVYDVSMVTGVKGKKGSILFSAGYYEQKDIFSGDRDWAKTSWYYDFQQNDGTNCNNPHAATGTSCYPNGSTSTPGGTIFDYGEDTGNAAWDALVASAGDSGAYYGSPDGWRDFNFDGNSDDGSGDLYNYTPANYLLTPAKRYNVYSQGRWGLGDSDKVDGYFEASYTKRKSRQELAPEPLTPGFYGDYGYTVSGDNYYNPFGRDFWDVRRRMVEGGNRIMRQDNDIFQVVLGIDGKFPEELKGWKWDINYNFGRSGGTWVQSGNYILSRIENAIGPSFRDPGTGDILCGTPDAVIEGCVPLNMFGGEGTITKEMIDYLSYTAVQYGYNLQNQVQASANGLLFTTPWNGDVRLAVGAEFRRLRGGFTPDPLTASGNTTTNASEPTGGYFDVMEGYGELSAVPISGTPLVKWLELSAALRGFNYNTFGSDFTWKAGLLWKMPAGVSVRGTYSTAFRAPSIADLYLGASESFPSVTDPCDTSAGPLTGNVRDQCAAEGVPTDFEDPRTQLREQWGGNPDAKPETAKIFTGGVVFEPPQAKGLALTLDAFWVHVENSIQMWGASTILSACYQNRNDAACDLISRNPATNLINMIDDRVTNIGGDKTAGLDFQIRYDWTHASAGRFRHNLEGTYTIKMNSYIPDAGTDSGLRVIEGIGVYDLGVFPRWKANFSTMWGLNDLGAGLNVRYIGSYKECEDDDCDTYLDMTEAEMSAAGYDNGVSRDVDANITADLFASYNLDTAAGNSKLTLGINNVLDQDPPFVVNSFLQTADTDYDFMGRYFYMRYSQSY